MKFVPRPYQVRDIKFMTTHKRCINANEPGLGKTVESLMALSTLGARKVLIVCPKIAFGVWEAETNKWLGLQSVILTGTKKQREEKLRIFYEQDIDVLITNYAQVQNLINMGYDAWDAIVADEIHLGGLLNHKTKKFKAFKKLDSSILYLLTGTPVRRGPQDLFAPLNLLYPKKFPHYWKFIKKYCVTFDGSFGMEIEPVPKNPQVFKSMLNSYMVRNVKKNVLPDLPSKQRQCIPIEMNRVQKKYYNDLMENMWLDIENPNGEDNFVITQNIAVLELRLRQLLVSPRLLGSDELGEGIETLRSMVSEEIHANRSVVVFSPFRDAIPNIAEVLKHDIEGLNVFVIQGGMDEKASDVAKRFKECKGKKVLIGTIKSAVAYDANCASTVFFLGYEWSANDNLQAEDRVWRFGVEHPVTVYYIMYKNSMDDNVMSKLDDKTMASNWILRTDEMIRREME